MFQLIVYSNGNIEICVQNVNDKYLMIEMEDTGSRTKNHNYNNIDDMIRTEEVDYNVGDYVYHETFGTGKVTEVSGQLISVAFKHPYGIKKLMKNHKKLSKI